MGVRLTEDQAAALFGGKPQPKGLSARTMARGDKGDPWMAMMTLAFLFVAAGILGDWWRLAAIGMAWMFVMVFRELRAINKKMEG